MKKLFLLLCFVCCLILFASCSKNDTLPSVSENETTTHQSEMNELESILADNSFNNYEQNEAIIRLVEKEISRGDLYAEKIKALMLEIKNDSFFSDRIDESTLKSVDNYCEYLKSEYDENSEFFDNIAMIKFGGGTAGSEWKCIKTYEIAKDYADKIESFYNEVEFLLYDK